MSDLSALIILAHPTTGSELRENMPNQLVVHVVGSKVDLQESRQVDLEDARTSLQQWIREDASSPDGSRPTSPHDLSAQGSPASPVTKMMSSPPPPRLSLSFSQSRKDALQSPSEPEPWCRADISEVSAKDDFGKKHSAFLVIMDG